MARFSVRTRIDAPKDKVWEVLADIGGIYKWNPGVSHSYSTSEDGRGDGATRHCDLTRGGYLEERAADWHEAESFKIDVYETNLPLRSNVVQFSVDADGDRTIVGIAPEYRIKFGLLGLVMDRLVLPRLFKKGMKDMLAGLKYHVETGELVGDRVPQRAMKGPGDNTATVKS